MCRCTFNMLPEDCNCAETCRSILILKYIIYRIVHLLVPTKSVSQFTMQGMNEQYKSDITHVAITAVEGPRDPCNPSPCGANAVCKERNGAGSCTCLPEYSGDPYTGCRPECVLNTDCNRARACVRNKCVDPCPGACGLNAECRVVNHAPSCSCLPGYTGNPLSTCSLPPTARKPLPFCYKELCFIRCTFSWSTSKWWNIPLVNFKNDN